MARLGSVLDAYDIIEQIGDGSFGTVHKAKNKKSQQFVAVKVMKKKYPTIEECAGEFEPRLLQLVPPHVNIVQIFDSCFSHINCDLSFVMEYMDGGNLYQWMRERKQLRLPFSQQEIRSILYQTLSAVSHIHHHNVFHRDMKPENLLLDHSTGEPIIKLADFGLAKELDSKPPYEEYVSTRWYRAPEVLLRSTDYSAPVDLWAVGAIFAELITLEPLFPGESEVDQIYRICSILGSPGNKVIAQQQQRNIQKRVNGKRPSPGFARKKTKDLNSAELSQLSAKSVSTHSTLNTHDGGGEWKEGTKLAYKIGFKFPLCYPKPLRQVIPNATESMLDLIEHFLCFNPKSRWTADYALRHSFFTSETDEQPHTVIQINAPMEPITPPDDGNGRNDNSRMNSPTGLLGSVRNIMTPKDLTSTVQSRYSFCSDWRLMNGTDYRPVSRDGRANATNTISMHSVEADSKSHSNCKSSKNEWLIHNRPIYSSHQKVHPGSSGPATSIDYTYASQYHTSRPDTPPFSKQRQTSFQHRQHGSIPLTNQRADYRSNIAHCTRQQQQQQQQQQHLQPQLIRWAPPHFIRHPRYTADSDAADSQLSKSPPERRRSLRRQFNELKVKDNNNGAAAINSSAHPIISSDIQPLKKLWSLSSSLSSSTTVQGLQEVSIFDTTTATLKRQSRFKIWLPVNEAKEDNEKEENNQTCTADDNFDSRDSRRTSRNHGMVDSCCCQHARKRMKKK